MGEYKRSNNDRRSSDRRAQNIEVSLERRQGSRRSGIDRRELASK